MSGVTNIAFRRLIKQLNPGAVGLVVTEFISIEGMTRGNAQSMQMMRYAEEERPISIQIFGHEISRMVDAAKMVEDSGANIVDINCGCPVPKVVKKGGGCELMRQPEHLARMLAAVKRAVSIPLTVKIRAGWDNRSRNAVEIARIAEDAGVSMLAIHGRSRQDLYRGEADWEIIEEVAESLHIPVVGSGDVVDKTTADRVLQGKIAGIMIGRGALANPWIFGDIHAERCGRTPEARPVDAIVDVLEHYQRLLQEEMSDKAALGRLKQLASQATRSVRGSAAVRRALCTSGSVDAYSEVLKQWREELHGVSPGRFSDDDIRFENDAALLGAAQQHDYIPQ
jgi:nifR3 family TIM-barrel protein